MSMKIAIFVTEAFYKKKDLYGVSGHVQIPLKAAALVAESHLHVDLITTRPRGATCLMIDTPDRLNIRTVAHATKEWPAEGVHKGLAFLQVFQLLQLVNKHKYDVVHFFGGPKTGLVGTIVKLFNPKIKVIFSPISEPSPVGLLSSQTQKWLFNKLDLIVPTSEFVRSRWNLIVDPVKTRVINPGVLKEMKPDKAITERNSVLFWRNADLDNGADIMIEVVRRIANLYPNVLFVFALRPGSQFQDEIVSLPSQFSNVNVHVHPYADGITIEKLLAKALFVVAPYRRLSINPQMSILETLLANVPVIASNVESNNEVVQHLLTGIIVDKNDADNFTQAVTSLIEDETLLRSLANNSAQSTRSQYNWGSFKNNLVKIYDGL